MQGDKQVIENFNCLLTHELIASNQLFVHAGIFDHLGLVRLNNIEYQESIDEMKHVDLCIKRILFLEGIPNIQKNFQELHISTNVEEILRLDLKLERFVSDNLRVSIAYADSVHDFVSRDIMTKILIDEEKHINFLETEITLIMKIGIHNYLQYQLK